MKRKYNHHLERSGESAEDPAANSRTWYSIDSISKRELPYCGLRKGMFRSVLIQVLEKVAALLKALRLFLAFKTLFFSIFCNRAIIKRSTTYTRLNVRH